MAPGRGAGVACTLPPKEWGRVLAGPASGLSCLHSCREPPPLHLRINCLVPRCCGRRLWASPILLPRTLSGRRERGRSCRPSHVPLPFPLCGPCMVMEGGEAGTRCRHSADHSSARHQTLCQRWSMRRTSPRSRMLSVAAALLVAAHAVPGAEGQGGCRLGGRGRPQRRPGRSAGAATDSLILFAGGLGGMMGKVLAAPTQGRGVGYGRAMAGRMNAMAPGQPVDGAPWRAQARVRTASAAGARDGLPDRAGARRPAPHRP